MILCTYFFTVLVLGSKSRFRAMSWLVCPHATSRQDLTFTSVNGFGKGRFGDFLQEATSTASDGDS